MQYTLLPLARKPWQCVLQTDLQYKNLVNVLAFPQLYNRKRKMIGSQKASHRRVTV